MTPAASMDATVPCGLASLTAGSSGASSAACKTWRQTGSGLQSPANALPSRSLQRIQLSQRRCAVIGAAALVALRHHRCQRCGRSSKIARRQVGAWEDSSCEIRPDDFAKSSDSKPGAPASQVALLLNRNAKGVRGDVEHRLMEAVGSANCWICCSEADAADALDQVLESGQYKVVVCGGGDGTVASLLNLTARARTAAPGVSGKAPAFCVLRLGTGNALAYLVGAKKDCFKDLNTLIRHVRGDFKTVPVLPAKILSLSSEDLGPESFEQKLCFFAGLGYDARMLKDYMWLRDRTKNGIFSNLIQSPLGYVAALLLRTLPATMRGEHVFHVRVTNLAEKAYFVDHRRGDWAIRRERGEVLFEGDVGILCAGAVPFYGGGFRLFPFAGLSEGFAHLRLSDIHPAQATLNVLRLWRGTYRNSRKVHDFLVKDVLVEVDKPTPFHHSGDYMGSVKKLRIQVRDDGQTELVDFLGDWSR